MKWFFVPGFSWQEMCVSDINRVKYPLQKKTRVKLIETVLSGDSLQYICQVPYLWYVQNTYGMYRLPMVKVSQFRNVYCVLCFLAFSFTSISKKTTKNLTNFYPIIYKVVKSKSGPRRASQVSALHVACLGLNDGAQLWIPFKLFSKQTFFHNVYQRFMIYLFDKPNTKYKY